MKKQETASLKNLPVHASRRAKPRFIESLLFIALALLVVGLLTCGFIIEAYILSQTPVTFLFGGNLSSCSPGVVDLRSVKYHSDHEYYNKLRALTPLKPPVFHGEHAPLCKNRINLKQKHRSFSKCLPISGRKDPIICSEADRMDVLDQKPGNICHASILHMLLVEVYEELQALGKSPVILYGSLLGAVREEGMIPFTEDADIGYSGRLRVSDDLHRLLWQKGYHLFFQDIWRVCAAPTHPLAAKLYDPTQSISADFAIPYLDLYYMNLQRHASEWKIDEMNRINGSNLISDDKVRPFSQVTINSQQFDTVHDPDYFLQRMYGDDFMKPKPRNDANPQGLVYF
ncbi:hypothetical protein PC129_g20983 [Phytophthora cactorum]|uniref:LicD family n=2 Tax=Phytophthora cactorum TaxID=29920 RepID=A0A329SMK7_9STRA|nr:hypothetical protein PC112_g21251 [Phytophthora cactorum]KAG2803786.1 hypothetical protein PC111_g18538 [Phytophthora cactorum]KAG2844978.1 hypothetical protein PC113_g18286 [Phytophthora cactorum]KAG2884979.1 hypothetical protein PC114_g19896 [Phytophthora cactorum]KAG2909812.1 hypothetical protein PC117_g19567 [Phytophthora cactorum]